MKQRRRSFSVPGWVVAAVVVASMAGCGPSSGQVRAAREARYQADAGVVFKAAADAVAAKYKIQKADAAQGVIQTVPRWYEKDGTYEDKSADGAQVMAEDGSVLLTFHVRVVGQPGPFQIQVEPEAVQVRTGYAAPVPLKAGDPAMTSWISGKVDDLYLTIHESLKSYELAPPGT